MHQEKKKTAGQSLVEYVALTALVAILSIGTVKMFGSRVKSRLNQITNAFDRNIQQGLKSRVSHNDEGDDEEGPSASWPGSPRSHGSGL